MKVKQHCWLMIFLGMMGVAAFSLGKHTAGLTACAIRAAGTTATQLSGTAAGLLLLAAALATLLGFAAMALAVSRGLSQLPQRSAAAPSPQPSPAVPRTAVTGQLFPAA